MNRLDHQPKPPSGARKIQSGVSSFVRDTLELAELQGMLFVEDARKAKSSVVIGVVLLAASFVLALGVVAVAVSAAGAGLASAMEWPVWGGQLAAAGLVLLATLAAAGVGVWFLVRATRPLSRSTSQLGRNWNAVRSALRGGDAVDETLQYQEWLEGRNGRH